MPTPKQYAERIVEAVNADPELLKKCDESPEPIRARIYLSGVVVDPENIDGTPLYAAIADEIEMIY